MCDDWWNVQTFLETHAKKRDHVLAINMHLNTTKLSSIKDSEFQKYLTEKCIYSTTT